MDPVTLGMAKAAARRLYDSRVSELETSTPTIDELGRSIRLADISAATTVAFDVALYPCELQQISFAWLGAVPASDTNYWTVQLRRHRLGEVDIIATKTTKATGGQAIVSATDWNFDTTVLSANGFLKGDVFSVKFTPTGTPAALTSGVASFRVPPADVSAASALFFDTFDRADATTLGTATDGQAWDVSTLFGIVSNQAKSSGAGVAVKFLPGITDNVRITGTLVGFPTSSSPGLYLNYIDADNYYSTTGTVLVRRVGGVSTNLASFDGGLTIAAGDRVRMERKGTVISVYIDKGNSGEFALAHTYTGQTQLTTGNGFGLRAGGNACIWDNVKVEAV